jgi:hypothetical protein
MQQEETEGKKRYGKRSFHGAPWKRLLRHCPLCDAKCGAKRVAAGLLRFPIIVRESYILSKNKKIKVNARPSHGLL